MASVSAIQAVYLDTSLIVAAVAQREQRPTVASFLETLLQNDAIVFVSELARVELGHAVKAIANDPAAITERERRKWRLHRWGDLQPVRKDWYEHCFANYDVLLAQFTSAEEVALNRSIIESAVDLMAVFQIDSNDAIHAATALAVGASSLATLDADFLKLASIPGLAIHLIR